MMSGCKFDALIVLVTRDTGRLYIQDPEHTFCLRSANREAVALNSGAVAAKVKSGLCI